MRTTPLILCIALPLAAAVAAGAADFDDRETLAGILTLDEQAPLADAEEALAEAESDLAEATADLEAAQEELDAASMTLADAEAALAAAESAAAAADEAETLAEMAVDDAEAALDQAILDGLPADQIALLEQALADAEAALALASQEAMDAAAAAQTAAMEVADAEAEAAAAQMALEDAQQAADGAQMAFDEAETVVQAILDEIEGTEEFVESLDDRQVFALNRSLHPAVQTGLLPLDIDLELLSRVTEEDLGNGEIQALTRGFRFELFFDRKAEQFADQGKMQQAERFAAKADEMLARNLARVDGPPGQAKKAANEAANQAANQAASDATNQAVDDAIELIIHDELQSKSGNGKGLAHAPGLNKP